eukprot:TRINITY_DN37104_c0_g1_i1.p1 TRINITY_DN37104_c0_g1~~TRINITY_DN37104_c0_g1_i1.p1  ORF type:complete len:278 (-),score=27.50 TRINITY_DN37104_c0_g1_i1:160-993(-)
MAIHLPLHVSCMAGDVSSFAFERGGILDGVPMLNISVGLKIQVPVNDLVNALAGFQESVTTVPKVVPRVVVEPKQPSRPEPSESQSSATNLAMPSLGETSSALPAKEADAMPSHMQPGPVFAKAMTPATNSSSNADWNSPIAVLQSGYGEYVTRNSFATLEGMDGKPMLHGARLNDYQYAKLQPPTRQPRTYDNQNEEIVLEREPWRTAEPVRASNHQGAQHTWSCVPSVVGARTQPAPKKQSAPYPAKAVPPSAAPKPVPVPPRNSTAQIATPEGS